MKAVRSVSSAAWLFVLFFGCWQALAALRILDPLFFPPPTRLLSTLRTLLASGEVLREAGRTLTRASAGFAAGAAAGILAAVLVSSWPWLRRATKPAIAVLYSSPKLTLLPMVMLLFGVNETSRMLLIGLSSFLLVVIQLSDAIRGVNPDYVDLAVNYGASQAMVIRRVYLPACLPQIFTAFRLAFGRSLVMTISIELLSGQDGLGSMIWSAWQTFAVEKLYVSVMLAGTLGLLFQWLFHWLERRLMPWQRPDGPWKDQTA